MNSKISCLLACAAALAGCTSTPPLDMARGTPVFATGQTEPVASRDDAADDPAIWVNASDPAQSLIVGTDKQAGLYVYGLDGAVRHFSAAGRVNNVDIRDGISFGGEEAIIVAASERADIANAHILFFRLNTDPVRLDQIARIPAGPGEAYGFCLGRAPDGLLHAFLNTKEGSIHHLVMDFEGEAQIVRQRTLQVPSQPEGCVVDERTGQLYVGEENAGIWRFDLETGQGGRVIDIDGRQLVADVEGLALAPAGETGGYLLASSQGDSAFAVYSLDDLSFAGRFYIATGNGFDAVTETDGIELSLSALGPDYPGGLLVVQDGQTPAGRQNFKLVDWRQVRDALGLD